MPQMPLGDHIRSLGQGAKSHVVALCPVSDDLATSAVHFRPPHRDPDCESGVHLFDGRKRPSGQHVVTHDADLTLDAALALRPVGGQHIDVEVVVPGERDRLGMQRTASPGATCRRTTVLVRS